VIQERQVEEPRPVRFCHKECNSENEQVCYSQMKTFVPQLLSLPISIKSGIYHTLRQRSQCSGQDIGWTTEKLVSIPESGRDFNFPTVPIPGLRLTKLPIPWETENSSPADKATEAWSKLPASILCRLYDGMKLYLYSLLFLRGT
jgi:hypothetical protein